MSLQYGNTPVPYVASWSAEDSFVVAHCPHARRLAICQAQAPGEGRPLFGKPHANRQREVIANGLCDTCGKSLKGRTKVSLSHARPVAHAHTIGDILQVEPLLHKECAAISMRHCPSLRRDIANGSLCVRQVTRYDIQFAVMSEEYVETITGTHCKAIGHAKVHLLAWRDRNAEWLDRRDA